jgi:geranyl diphosphate synthase
MGHVRGMGAQMTSSEEDLLSLEHYVRKTFYKTASLMANSAKAVAILGGQSREVSELAWQYGRHLGLAFQVAATLTAPAMTVPKTLIHCRRCPCRDWQGASTEGCYAAAQFVDDVLDFTGSTLQLGKPALNDLRSGLATAPVLYAAEVRPLPL